MTYWKELDDAGRREMLKNARVVKKRDKAKRPKGEIPAIPAEPTTPYDPNMIFDTAGNTFETVRTLAYPMIEQAIALQLENTKSPEVAANLVAARALTLAEYEEAIKNPIELSDKQQAVADAIVAHVTGGDRNEINEKLKEAGIGRRRRRRIYYVLKGLAGAGKSRVVSQVAARLSAIEDAKEASERLPIAIAAPSNQARLALVRAGWKGAMTVATLLHDYDSFFVADEDDDSRDEPIFTTGALKKRFSVIILDEASMISPKDIRLAGRLAHKVILVGDPVQLPPIEDGGGKKTRGSRRPASRGPVKKKSRPFHTSRADGFLDEIFRQKAGSGILKLARLIRDGVLFGEAADLMCPEDSAKAAPDLFLLRQNWDDNLPVISRASIAITATNDERRAINAAVRKLKGFTSPLPMPGDFLVSKKTDRSGRGLGYLTNGALLEVVSEPVADTVRILTTQRRGVTYAFRENQVRRDEDDDDVGVKSAAKATTDDDRRGVKVKRDEVVFQQHDDFEYHDAPIIKFMVKFRDAELAKIAPFEISIDRERFLAESTGKDQVFSDRLTQKLHEEALNNLHIVDFGYAVTCHAAQGSGYDNVIIIAPRGGTRANTVEWCYTATTRAIKVLVVFLGEPRQRAKFLHEYYTQPSP